MSSTSWAQIEFGAGGGSGNGRVVLTASLGADVCGVAVAVVVTAAVVGTRKVVVSSPAESGVGLPSVIVMPEGDGSTVETDAAGVVLELQLRRVTASTGAAITRSIRACVVRCACFTWVLTESGFRQDSMRHLDGETLSVLLSHR